MSALSNFFFTILEFLQESLTISWAWAIVLLTVIIRVALIPLTWRQIKSMRAMQALQPHIKLLQEKYKDDRRTPEPKGHGVLSREQGESIRVLPASAVTAAGLSGSVLHAEESRLCQRVCGRWGVLNGVARGACVWLWIGDITKFDLGLLAAYMGSQFVNSWQMGRKSAGQQRAIAFIMPVIIGVFSYWYKWPAGLMLYWFTTNVWSIAQQFVAEKIMPVPVAAQEILEKDKAKLDKAKSGPKSGGKSAPKADGGATTGTKQGPEAKRSGQSAKRSGSRRRR